VTHNVLPAVELVYRERGHAKSSSWMRERDAHGPGEDGGGGRHDGPDVGDAKSS
jgi:hypothetical protein